MRTPHHNADMAAAECEESGRNRHSCRSAVVSDGLCLLCGMNAENLHFLLRVDKVMLA